MGRVRAFDDLYTWLHFAYVLLLVFLLTEVFVTSSIIFYAY